jgi:hypothetical protein
MYQKGICVYSRAICMKRFESKSAKQNRRDK